MLLMGTPTSGASTPGKGVAGGVEGSTIWPVFDVHLKAPDANELCLETILK